MFRSKKQVDHHVHEVLRKFQNETERNLRCYNIAQQYYKVRDYESAKHYLSLYLSVKEDSPLAYKLQGQIWEGIGDKARALNAYKTSLEYDANQPDLVLKMCELLCETDISFDIDRAHYWCERGSNLFPHDPTVFRLKEKLLKLGGNVNNKVFEDLINTEIKARPNDLAVRIRLMQLYLDTGRTKAAFNHAVELENAQTFAKELSWYECFAQVCQAYAEEFPSQVDWLTFCTWVSVLDKVASLTLSELVTPKKIVDCVQAIFNMDQVLFKSNNVSAPKENLELYKQFQRHMTAQMCFHLATLILKRAKKEPSNWKEATTTALPLLFLSQTAPPESEAAWCLTPPPSLKNSLAAWTNNATYRLSQAGYILLALSKGYGEQFVQKVNHMTSSTWRERTFQKVFTSPEHRTCMTTSHFIHNNMVANVPVVLPTHDSGNLRISHLVPVYEKTRDTLHHLVWLGLEVIRHNNKKLPLEFHTYSFNKLKFSTLNPNNTSSETLTILDVDAFLYASVFCAAANLEEEVLNGFYSNDRPIKLPADITNLLCTQDQINWWELACKVNRQQFNQNMDLVALRQRLQRGLEVIRAQGNHGLDVLLLAKLARTFADRAANASGRSSEQSALEARASLYWNAALPLLEKMEKVQVVWASNTKFFDYHRKELSVAEVNSLLEEGRLFVAISLMKSEEHERAIDLFKPLRSPYASYHMAMIYKKLAGAQLEARPREEITSEMRSKHVILLSKARDCLNLTWERIRNDRKHPLHKTLPDHISEVESALSRIEPDHVNHSQEDANMSDISLTSLGSLAAGDMGFHTPKLNGETPTPHSRNMRHYSTPDHRRSSHKKEELVNVSQLLQVQNLYEEIKKMQEKLEQVVITMNDLKRDVTKMKVQEDLYLFPGAEEEEYPEDVLNGQYPPTFVGPYPAQPQATPTFYPPPPRGVQGTSTVTYGAPPPVQQQPVIPLLPMAGYQTPQNLPFYNPPTLPYSDPHISDFLRATATIPNPILPQQPPPPPVNVVITTSDTLPTGPPAVQPPLSVTIPPQHRLGTLTNTPSTPAPPHNFQIAMPATATIPSLEKSPIVIPDDVESGDENEVGYDPCPDFKPIIPLPKEVSVTTGEEEDDILFESRAKLFRFIEKEWKERGVGVMKILKNRSSNKVRLLMRRDQVHKICANHLLTSDMELSTMQNSDRAFFWVANDFAEEVLQLEKFSIRFKTPEEALKFRDVFNEAKTKYGQSPVKSKDENETKQIEDTKSKEGSISKEENLAASTGKLNLGGFTFTSPPTLKETTIEKSKVEEEKKKDSEATASPFAKFTFTPQKPVSTPIGTGAVLKPSGLNVPLFAGLNSTQNKHTLFENQTETASSLTTDCGKQSAVTTSTNQSVPAFNFAPKPTSAATFETPKSILKEPVLGASNATTPVSTSKSPSSKHVLFQDSLIASSTNQTPTLATLLTSPSTQVVDFAALSKVSENQQQFGSVKKTSGFEGAGSTVFGNSRPRNDSEGENAEEFVPNAEFKPVIPLPELVEVKTGEEGQEVIFNERAKLMRFEPNTKEWKERGLGQMKILKDPASGISRFLMRREQVLKVCCNHRIIQSLELKASPSSEKAWTWFAVDYSEEEPKNELLCIRFKTADLAKAFKEAVEKVQKQMREEGMSKRSCPDSTQEVTSSQTPVKNELPKLTDMFRPKSGSWECKDCYTWNGAKVTNCECCDSVRKPKSPGPASPSTVYPSPSTVSASPSTVSASPVSVANTVTSTMSLAEKFKPKPGSWECKACFVRNDGDKTVCIACSSVRPGYEDQVKASPKTSNNAFSLLGDNSGSGFSFGIKNNENTTNSFTFGVQPFGADSKAVADTTKATTTGGTGFGFGDASKTTPFNFTPQKVTSSAKSEAQESKPGGGMFMFGNTSTPPKPSFSFGASEPSQGEGSKFTFGQGGKFEFNFSGVKSARSPGAGSKSPRSPGTGQETDSEPEEVEDEGDHIVFQPIVPLPDKVPVTTGEEDEIVLYSHRAKLYRFDQGEWKERGVGDIKILRHNDTHRIRLLMRREPILKICLNHFLTSDINFTPKDDKSWLWYAPDFADGQITKESFCLRLKTPEIASEFKKAIESAQGGEDALSNEVEVVYEVKVPEDLRQAALKLQLPPNFYSYLEAPPCPGCAGCEPDSEDEGKSPELPPKTENFKENALSNTTTSVTTTTTTAAAYQPFTFTVKTTTTTTSPSVSVMFTRESSSTPSSTSLFSTPASSNFSFTFNSPATTVPPVEGSPKPTVFGSSSPQSPNSATSFFGGSPLFQSQPVAKSVFGGSSIFGNSTPPSSKPGAPLLFGTTAPTTAATTLSFGQSSTQLNSVFGDASKNSKTTSLFSQTVTNSQSTPPPSENSSSQKNTPFLTNFQPFKTSVFGGTSPASVFGTPTTQPSAPVFGTLTTQPSASVFGTPTTQPSASVFGTPTTQPSAPVFGTPTTQPSIFGGNTQTPASVFGGLSTQTEASTNNGPTFLFKSTTSFSDIAAKTTNQTPFGSDKTSSNFSWAGAGTTVFGGSKATASKTKEKESKDKTEEEEGSDAENDEETEAAHDPVFEPIVPLPDKIEVRTGEEEEDKEFCSRAKFYRYDTDTKEWKERGTGEMKILKHRETNTYRLLLRREQVHKVVCNQLVTAELEITPLASSDKSFCWAGMNMAEEYTEPRLEKVAVRFKNSDIANEFKDKLLECIAAVKSKKESQPLRSPESLLEPEVTVQEEGGYSEEEGQYGDDEDYEDEGDVMFEKRVTLYIRSSGEAWMRMDQGELSVTFNSEMNMSHVVFKGDNEEEKVVSTVERDSIAQESERAVTWRGLEGDEEFKAEFSSQQAASEFVSVLSEALELSLSSYDHYHGSDTED